MLIKAVHRYERISYHVPSYRFLSDGKTGPVLISKHFLMGNNGLLYPYPPPSYRKETFFMYLIIKVSKSGQNYFVFYSHISQETKRIPYKFETISF